MNEEAYLDELDRQFETNIDAISSCSQSLLAIRKAGSDVTEFFEWFAKWSHKTIDGNPDYPTWLERLTRMSKSMKKKRHAEDPIARVVTLISNLINDISYCGTEKHHVDKSLEILALLKNLSDEEANGNTR